MPASGGAGPTIVSGGKDSADPNVQADYGMVTISLGVASRIPFHQNCIESLVSGAEQVLYAAKNRGRDQFCSAADDVNVMADGTV